MSKYCRKLDAVAQSRYLKLLDPEEKDDLSYTTKDVHVQRKRSIEQYLKDLGSTLVSMGGKT